MFMFPLSYLFDSFRSYAYQNEQLSFCRNVKVSTHAIAVHINFIVILQLECIFIRLFDIHLAVYKYYNARQL